MGHVAPKPPEVIGLCLCELLQCTGTRLDSASILCAYPNTFVLVTHAMNLALGRNVARRLDLWLIVCCGAMSQRATLQHELGVFSSVHGRHVMTCNTVSTCAFFTSGSVQQFTVVMVFRDQDAEKALQTLNYMSIKGTWVAVEVVNGWITK